LLRADKTGHDLARVDPYVNLNAPASCVLQLAIAHGQSRPNRPFRVVFMGHRRAKGRDHLVTRDGNHGPAETLHFLTQAIRAGMRKRLDILRVQSFGDTRKVGQIRKKQRGPAPFIPCSGRERGRQVDHFDLRQMSHRLANRLPALITEMAARRVDGPAARAHGIEPSPTGIAEPGFG
jgi:hypothetical protein